LAKAEAIKPVFATKARKTRVATSLQPPEKTSVCLINAFERRALQVHRHRSVIGVALAQLCKAL